MDSPPSTTLSRPSASSRAARSSATTSRDGGSVPSGVPLGAESRSPGGRPPNPRWSGVSTRYGPSGASRWAAHIAADSGNACSSTSGGVIPAAPLPQIADWPPSTTSTWPVMNDDASEARNTAGPAISSARPHRPIGMVESRPADACSSAQRLRFSSVAVHPGHSAFTRTPLVAHSTASDLVSEITAAFDAPYGVSAGVAPSPATLARLITEARPAASRCPAAACSTCTVDSTFSRITFSQPVNRSWVNGTMNAVPPALLTTMSRPPMPRTAACTMASIAARSVTSAGTTTARLPRCSTSAATFSSASAFRLFSATSAPCSARASAIACPMPRDAPVTSALRPVRSNSPMPPPLRLGVVRGVRGTSTVVGARPRLRDLARESRQGERMADRTRAVVTGGAGFLGSHLCERLLLDGWEVVCLDNFLTGTPVNVAQLSEIGPFRLVRTDVSEYVHVVGRVDAVLHFASPASPVDYLKLPIHTLKVGAIGTLHTLGLAREKGARYVLASTSEVYGDPQVHPQPESYWGHVNPVGPRGVYDEAKRFAEAMTMAYHRFHGLDTKIVRIFNTYGPRMRLHDGRAVPAFMSQTLRNEDVTVFGDGSQTRSFTYISDLVDGIIRLMLSAENDPINIGNPREMTIEEIATTIIRMTGSKSKIVYRPLPTDDPKQRRPDIKIGRASCR